MGEDNEWETIQPSSTYTTQSDEDDGDTVVITTPTNPHEALPVSLQPVPRPPSPPPSSSSYSSSSSSSSSNSTEITDGELPQPAEVRITLINTTLRILSSWVLRVCYGIRSRIRFFSIAAFVTVTAYAWRWRRLVEKDKQDKMLLLINQKDEKIKQLLLQIDRMNEALSGRRRVPVHRVLVDSPFVLRPRSNWKSN